MAKKKSGSELEHLRGVVRNQRSEIKALKKELSRFQKRQHQFEDWELEKTEELLEEDISQPSERHFQESCPECSSGVEKSELGNRILTRCTKCKWRRTQKV